MPDAPGKGWYLEGLLPGADHVVRVPLNTLPFRVGRNPESMLPIGADAVSWTHAEVFEDGVAVCLRDLGSTNGTWHNGERVRDAVPLKPGDLVQFASIEFKVGLLSKDIRSRTILTTAPGTGDEDGPVGSPRVLRAMLRERAVKIVYQPIFDVGDESIYAFEALGRADFPGLPKAPHRLFLLAGSLGLAGELSQLLRQRAIEEAQALAPKVLFLNSHPSETHTEALLTELADLRSMLPSTRLVLEVHEAAITDPAHMRQLSERLADLGVALAYDDFGAGQARLAELAEAPPHYLKFDRSLVHNLDLAAPRKQQMVASLVKLAHELGVITLAEGIEREAEGKACQSMGFTLVQGFYYGKPAAAGEWVR